MKLEINPITTWLMITSKYAHHIEEYENYMKHAPIDDEVKKLLSKQKKK